MRRASPAIIGLLFFAASVCGQNISTVAGGSDIYSNVPTLTNNLPNPQYVVVDAAGNFYIALSGDQRIWKVDTTGTLTVFAGTGTCGFTGDGGAAVQARLCSPLGMAFNAAGNLFIADQSNQRIRKIDMSTGIITTVAGIGSFCSPSTAACGDGGPATSANLGSPRTVTFDSAGNMFIADQSTLRVRRIDASTSIITTIAGNGMSCNYNTGTNPIPCADGGPATSTGFQSLIGVTADAGGNVFIVDQSGERVRKVVASTGIINTFAGTGTRCSPFIATGPATSVNLCDPFAATMDSGNNLWIADTSLSRIRKVDSTGNLTTLNFTSTSPNGISFDSTGQLFVAYSGGNRIWRVNVSTSVGTIVAGDGFFSFAGDGGAATSARMNNPAGVTMDAGGNMYISDASNSRVRKVDTSGNISTLRLMSTARVKMDNSGNLLVASSCQILRVNPSTLTTTTVAGTGGCGFAGDGGAATSALLSSPQDVTQDAQGNFFIADTSNHRVRRVDAATGIITTVAGIGPISVPCGNSTCLVGSFSGDGGPATQAGLNFPYGVAVDAGGNVFILDSNNHRVRRVDASTGIINTVAGNASACGTVVDGVTATSSPLCFPRGLIMDASANMFIGDTSFSRVRRVDGQSGVITTVAGGGGLGDGNPATSASVPSPWGLYLTSGGNLLITQASSGVNARAREVFVGSGSPAISLSASSITFADQNVNTTSAAQTLTITNTGTASLWTNNIVSGSAEFTRTNNCPTSLAPGGNCTVTITFRPSTYGIRSSSLTINDNAPGAPHNVPLSGKGLGVTISVSPANLNFGNQIYLTTSAAQTVTVTNSGGTVSLNITGISTSSNYPQTNNCVGISFSVGASCTINVSFKPQTIGAINVNLGVSSNAFSGTSVVALTGIGQTTTTTSISAPTITYPANATVTVTISPNNICSGSPNGTIDLVVDGAPPITQPTTATGCSSNSVFTLAGLTAGSHTLNATYNSTSAVYLGSTKAGTQTVNKGSQTITFPALSNINFGDPAPVLGATASSGLSVSYSVVSGPATVTGSTLTVTGAGTVTVKASQAGDSNWNAATSVNQSFTVSKGNQTILFNAPPTHTYGDPPFGLSATASSGLTVSFSVLSGPATILGNVLTINGAGTITVRASQAGDSNWNAASNVDQSFTVNKANASVTPNAASKTYGTSDPAFSGTLTGFLAADNVTASYSRMPGETVAGSPYTISATLAPAGVLGNYNITYNTPSFGINPANASVTPNAASKTYGTADPAFTGTLNGFLAADNVVASYSRTAGEAVAGSPYTISATLAPAGALGNYTITYNTAVFTISKANASVTPNAASKTYGTAEPAFTGTLNGFLAADNLTASYSRAAGETVGGSPYTISATLAPAAVLANYNVTYNTASFTINPAAASVTPNVASKTYGTADPALTGTLSGFLAPDNVVATYSRTSGETVAGSPYAISATLSPGSALSNYAITYNNASFTINPASASVMPNSASKTYGTVDPALTGTLSGFLAADNVTASFNRTAGEAVVGSPYTISATLAPAGVLANYNITYNTASFTINKANASVTPNAASKTYGTAEPALTGTLSGFLAADNVTASYSRTAGETVAGSPYTISATLNSAALGNYNIAYNTSNFTITAKAASVTPNAASKTYGAADPALTGTLTGFLAADNVTATYSRAAGETVAGSPYTISAALSPASAFGNYSITYNTAAFTINKAPLTITAVSTTKVLDAPNPNLNNVTYSGFAFSDGPSSLGGTLNCATTAATTSPVGSYPITCSGQTSFNYAISNVAGTLKVLYASGGMCDGDVGHSILQPINSDGSSVWKQGGTVPAKFRVCDANGASIGGAGVVSNFVLYQINSGTIAPVDETVVNSTNDLAWHFDSSAQQWIFNLSTKTAPQNVANQTYYYRIDLNDGTSIYFDFGLK